MSDTRTSLANPRRTRLVLRPTPGAPARVVLDLTALAREAQQRTQQDAPTRQAS